MRAYSDNEELALLSGIDPTKIVIYTWVIVYILATIAGTLYGLDKSFKPFAYWNNLLPIFAATIWVGSETLLARSTEVLLLLSQR